MTGSTASGVGSCRSRKRSHGREPPPDRRASSRIRPSASWPGPKTGALGQPHPAGASACLPPAGRVRWTTWRRGHGSPGDARFARAKAGVYAGAAGARAGRPERQSGQSESRRLLAGVSTSAARAVRRYTTRSFRRRPAVARAEVTVYCGLRIRAMQSRLAAFVTISTGSSPARRMSSAMSCGELTVNVQCCLCRFS